MTQPSLPAVATPLFQLYRHVWQHAAGVRARMAMALAMLGGSQLLKLAMPWMAAQAINSIQTAGIAGLAAAGRGPLDRRHPRPADGRVGRPRPGPRDGALGGAACAPQRG